jgi:hypothetical protein
MRLNKFITNIQQVGSTNNNIFFEMAHLATNA